MATTKEIAEQVRLLGAKLDQLYTQNSWNKNAPATNYLGGYWYGPSCNFMIELINYAARRIEGVTDTQLKDLSIAKFLGLLPEIVNGISVNNITSDPDAVGGGIITLMNTVISRLPPNIPTPPKPKIDWQDISTEPNLLPQDLLTRLKAVEGRLKRLEPRSETAEAKLVQIEAVHDAAVQLPTDMEELANFRNDLERILADSKKTSLEIEIASEKAEIGLDRIALVTDSAENAVKRSEDALRGSTGVGLANAFVARKEELSRLGIWWVLGLVVSLGAAILIGADRVSSLKEVLISDRSSTVIWVNALLAALGVGAPIWFAWLSTKQIGANFKLAEDYAFKASVSKAYEGYRKEAVEIDPILRDRLFATALSRLEQEPLRLVSKEDHSSPLQEALNSPALKSIWGRVPGLYDEVITLVRSKDGGTAAVIGSAAAVANAVNPKVDDS